MKSKFRTRDFKEKKQRGEKIAMLTAYDANMARLLERAGVDAILVGDSSAWWSSASRPRCRSRSTR